MKQRLIKVIVCLCLAVSVFLCTSFVALADDSASESDSVIYENGDVVGSISLEGVSQEYDLSTVAEVGENDYTGVTSIHTQTSYASIKFSNYVGNYLGSSAAYASFDLPVPVLFRMAVERGHTYSGQIYFYLHVSMPSYDTTTGDDFYRQVSLGDFEQVSNYEGVVVSYYGFTGLADKAQEGTCDVTVCITFDNYQPTFTGTLNVNSFFTIYGYFQNYTGIVEEGTTYFPHPVMTCTVSSDWAGELYDYPTSAIVDSDGTLIKNQTEQQLQISQQEMQQQQQIADQQAQQSAQQHEDLKTGFQDDTYNSSVSAAGSQVDSYIDQESVLMNQQQNQIGNYAADNFNTGLINNYLPAIAMVSTWYVQIWDSFGNLNGAFVAILSLGVASLIIGLKRRGS